ncbi:hypothetical protein HY498_03460 [Candidatus Woesearchaeota archaeon]|nr:hypothetical protein [Candidatus Woesearchaeota archaeon]
MEEKYLYTIAIIVVFAGFLFTSIGNYTGYQTAVKGTSSAVERSVMGPERHSALDASTSDSSITPGFGGETEEELQGLSEELINSCTTGQEGFERVTDTIRGEYKICSDGTWLPKKCPEGNRAMQRGTSVVCQYSEYNTRPQPQ